MNDTNFKIKKKSARENQACLFISRSNISSPQSHQMTFRVEYQKQVRFRDTQQQLDKETTEKTRSSTHTHTKICKYTLHESHGTWSLYDFAVYFIRRNTQLLVMKVFKFFFRMTWDSDTVTIKPYRTSKVQVKAKSCLQCFFSSCGLGLCGEMLSLYAFYRCICWVHLENRISSFNNKLSFRWR